MTGAKRGRPRKDAGGDPLFMKDPDPAPVWPVECGRKPWGFDLADPLVPCEIEALEKALLSVPEVAAMPPETLQTLVERIAPEVTHYRAGRALSRTLVRKGKSGTGPKPKIERRRLMDQTAAMWADVTGQSGALWVEPGTTSGASVALYISQAVLAVCDGLARWEPEAPGSERHRQVFAPGRPVPLSTQIGRAHV